MQVIYPALLINLFKFDTIIQKRRPKRKLFGYLQNIYYLNYDILIILVYFLITVPNINLLKYRVKLITL